jgi:hypothetical protein
LRFDEDASLALRSAKACAIPNAIDFVSFPEMFVVTATTIPRWGKVRNDVEPPSKVRLAWPAIRVGAPPS